MREEVVRDRPEINRTVSSDLDDFSAADIALNTCKGKSSRDESNFPSRSVRVIPGRSLRTQEPEESLSNLSEEIYQAALELDLLLKASNGFESAYSSLVGKVEDTDE